MAKTKTKIELPENLKKAYNELRGIIELAEYALLMRDHDTMHYAELRRIEVSEQIFHQN